MQFQVPQFIDTEDKIVGPFTLKQFGFVAAGGVLSAILYFTVEPWLWVIGSIFIFGAAIALAFVKIEGRPFVNVIISAFNFYWKPQTYVWQPEHPKIRVVDEKVKEEAGKSALEEILAKSSAGITKIKSATTKEISRAASAFSQPTRPLAEKKTIAEMKPAAEPKPAAETKQTNPQPAAPAAIVAATAQPISRKSVSIGSALHKSWEDLQTGAPLAKKNSDKQFLDRKMAERYQIFQRAAGDRHAAKRIDYR